ncbi:hemagglutinin repeat-containing protein [Paraburkholderia terricola]|uniref:Filamentous hemagglutinin n=1 Tax=Paraburkholderia terricola TaxID=169427 RepID=A0ABU1LLY5_9BURK|nr:hemagglutinin repeat-containing protein [Paraburkholderia terricola]MDR6407759.1 filamentous hemagglutinin [Paraburkholderia terricola]MDR6480026.1 filamentous hemagglutinin [Paraburkholderia terricola]
MNRGTHRLVFSRLRGMLVAVEETATATGKQAGQTTLHSRRDAAGHTAPFTLRQIAFAALALLGVLPAISGAQIVPGGAHAPSVIQTQNGLDQVNINRPSGAGVSVNTYGQFDVQQRGAILNNSPTIVQTQQAGMINGNPNFGPGQSARIIVNQVNSGAASQINGHLEVAGQRAEVVIANGSGISVNGGGFINTSRAILTTGTPNFAADGSLTGFNVTGGNITVQGAGLNASNVDQVDLIARAVQANAAIHAKNLNVVTGANAVGHDTLTTTPIAGDGPAPGVSIDVSNLGGMYANRIVLVGTENGVGVSNRGVLAAQAGDLILTAQGRLVLAGQTNASGSINVSARDGIDNSGTTYAQRNVTADTSGALTNSGVLAAQQNTTVTAGSVASTGTLGAGVNGDGTIANAGDLSVSAQGALSATGRNEGGGNTTIQGASVSLAGSNTSANGTLTLAASSGDLDLSGATTTAGGALDASAAGMLTNDHGNLSGGSVQVTAANVSNRDGQFVSGGALNVTSAGGLSNQGGTIQAAGALSAATGSLENTAGRIVSLGSDGMTLTTTGALVNGTGGTIGTNGALSASAGTLANQGKISAASDARVRAQGIDNHAGTIGAGGALDVATTGALNNAAGTLSGAATTVSAASIDNTSGGIEGDTLAVSASGDLTNCSGRLTQYGTSDQTVRAGGTLDNTGGTIASNANSLTVSGRSVANDSGTLQHAGTGSLDVSATAAVSNVAGTLQTNGALAVSGERLDNTHGTLSAQNAAQVDVASDIVNRSGTLYGHDGLTLTAQSGIDNTDGSAQTAGDLSVTAGGALSNARGTLTANGAHGVANVTAASLDNTAGRLTNAGDGATIVSAASVTSTGGTLGGNGDVTLNAQTLANDAGANLVAGGAANLNVMQAVNNAGGTIFGGTALNLNQAGAAVINDGGAILGGLDVSVNVASLSNAGGAIRANRDISASGTVAGDGDMVAGRNLSLAVLGDYTNSAANNLHADGDMSVSATGTLTNAGTLAAAGALTATGANVVNSAGADINSSSTTVNAVGTLTNDGRIEGDTVTTSSATLANTGTVIGNNVTVNADDVRNTGAAAVIAGANSVRLYAQNSVNNADGALIYSAGNLEIAKDGTRDASGMLANQTGSLTNSAATIEADGDIDIAARTVSNVRTGVVTQAGTPQDAGSTTLTLWTGGMSVDDLGFYDSFDYPQWRWSPGAIGGESIGKLMTPITVTVPKSQVTNLDATKQTLSLTQPLTDTYISATTPLVEVCNAHDFCSQQHVKATRTITSNATQYYNSITDNGSTYTITLWPDYDPKTNIRPDQVVVRTDLGSDSHDYVEMSRTSTTTTATDQLVSAGNAATLRAQGAIRINADGGSISNQSSTMAAGGDLVRRATGGSVNDTGIVLQQTVTQDSQSTFYWHQKTGGSNDTQVIGTGITQSTTSVDALPAIATSNQTVQTDARDISINSVNRQGQTVAGSGVTGGSADGTQTGTISGQSSRPQTVGGATGGIPNLKLPVSGLYTYNTAPGATYLVVTDPRFTQYGRFISSDYMLGQLGLDPQKIQKRLGDGLYEERLMRDQVTQLTGRTFLAGYTDNLAQYTALMNNGVAYAKAFGLEPGIALSPAQMQQLTTDMVWLVSQDVTLPDGSHQTVLVPQVYLAQSSTVDLAHSGALVAGNAVNLNASGDVNNSGHVSSNLATTIIGNNITNRGVIGSAGATAVAAVHDVRNTGGRIGGGDVVVQAGRDVVNETQTYGVSKSFGSNTLTGSVTGTGVDAIGTISATNSATVIAGRDVNLTGATIQAGGNAAIAAGRDLTVGTITLTSTRDVQTHDGLNGGHDRVTQNLGSAIVAGANLATVSGRDTTFTGATVQAGGDAAMVAGNNLTVTAAKDTHEHREQSMGGSLSHHMSSSYDESVQGSNVSAGGNVTLAAGQSGGGNLAILGSSVTTDAAGMGGVRLVSTGDVTIGGVGETHDSQRWSHDERSGFLSKQKTTDAASSHQVIAQGSTVSGDTVTGAAGHDMTVSGSTIAATHDVTLAAGNNLTINTAQDTSESSHFHQEVKTGLGSSGGVGISYGKVDQKDTTHDSSVTQNGSLVGSTGGSVNLSAGADLHVTGSDLIAARNVTGTGANVIVDAATGTSHHDEVHEVSKSGFTLAVKAPLLDAISNTVDQARAASHGQDDRAAALHGMAAASSAIDAYGAGGGAVSAIADGGKPEAKIELSYGSSHSRNTFAEDSTTNQGSSVSAGGTAAFVATGNGTPGSGNLTIAGSNVNAHDVILAAKNQVNLVNTTDTDSTRSTNQSSSASVGISYGTQGFGVSASMSKAHGDANSDAAMQNNTHVTAANTATVISGGDTNIIGANVNGRQVNADAGGNLNIASVQDTMTSAAHQESTGGGFAISQGGGSASFSHTNANASGSYAGVNEQAGIQAGDGGFNISVKGNTDLKGAVIASDAEASKNVLSTGTLTFSDIENQSSYNAHSGGFSGGVTTGDGGANYGTHGPASSKNAGGGAPMLSQNDSGSDSATTRSGVSAGTISVTDATNQTHDVAGLNRDTSNTNGTVEKLPDVSNLLDRQADMMAAASAAGEAVSRRIGDFAQSKYDEAKANGDQTGMDAWKEGGTARAEMQAAGAALVTGLAGGNAIGGAAGAGIASIAGGRLNELSGAIAGSNPTGNADMNTALGSIVANVIATGAGAVVDGDAGAFSAYNVDRYNRQLHPEERQWAKDNAKQFADFYKNKTGQDISTAQAENMLLANGYRLVDAAASKGPGGDTTAVAFISQNSGNMFTATAAEYNSLFLYGNKDGSLTPEQRALPGAIANPKVGLAVAGALAAPAVLPALAAIPGAPIFSTGGALGSAALAAPNGIGLISGAVNATSQYIQTGSVNPVDVGYAYVGGFAGTYGGFLWNVGVNAATGAADTATNNAISGTHDSVAVGSAVNAGAAAFGYGIGLAAQLAITKYAAQRAINGTNWATTGAWSGQAGKNLFTPNNLPVIGSGFGGAVASETGTSTLKEMIAK